MNFLLNAVACRFYRLSAFLALYISESGGEYLMRFIESLPSKLYTCNNLLFDANGVTLSLSKCSRRH